MPTSQREFIIKIIELYKNFPCLWKTTDPHYHDKNQRNTALDQLLQLFKEEDPTATKDVVVKKINSMRGAYRKELNKVRQSEKSGVSADDVHIPKLWYYDMLHFLGDQEVPRASVSTNSIIDDLFMDDEVSQDDPVPSPSQDSNSGMIRKRPRTKANEVLEKIAKKIDESNPKPATTKQPYDAFGEHVAEKLRSLTQEMAPICSKLISEAIFLAELQCLHVTAKIVPKQEYLIMEDET